MKQKAYVLFMMMGLAIFSGSAAFAMDAMPTGGCCSSDMGMGCSDMSSCDHAACTSSHMESMECQPGCVCCAMCPEGGCRMNMTKATVDFNPGNMNIKNRGLYLTAYIEIDENDSQYTVDQMDKMSIYRYYPFRITANGQNRIPAWAGFCHREG